jgi:hypothetical protein
MLVAGSAIFAPGDHARTEHNAREFLNLARAAGLPQPEAEQASA